jgi:hypothetical protein
MMLAATAALAFIWYKNHREMARLRGQLEPGLGVTDEAATAFDDTASQLVNGRDRDHPLNTYPNTPNFATVRSQSNDI